MTTTFRQDIVAGILSVLNDYATANPAQLVRAYSAKPLNVAAADLPAAYIDVRDEVVRHSEGVRWRRMSPTIVLVARGGDALETIDKLDSLVDGLLDALSATPQFATATVWDQAQIKDIIVVIGEYEYSAVRITINDVEIREGRS